jgi:flagellin
VSASLTLSFQVGANVQDNKLNDQITITLDDLSNNSPSLPSSAPAPRA